MVSPVPADPVSSAILEPVAVPSIDVTAPDIVPPVPAPRRRVEDAVPAHPRVEKEVPASPEQPPEPEKESVQQMGVVETVSRPVEELKSFEESEVARKEKRDFILSLSDEELGRMGINELVAFYEFLTMEEIKELENRHSGFSQKIFE